MPIVSALTAGVLLLLQTLLMLTAAMGRQRARQALGDGGDAALQRAVRRHGNLAENAAIFLVGVALYEMMGGPRLWVEGFCAVFVFARVIHAIGLSLKNTVNIFRVLGVVLTVAVDIWLGLRLVSFAVAHLPALNVGLAQV
jgi:uncharacterized membrane protein YecN with MAPEG domain